MVGRPGERKKEKSEIGSVGTGWRERVEERVEEAGYVYEALGGFYGGSKIVDSKRERLAIV